MGRHSAGERGPFYRSLVGWFLPWILIAAVVGAAVWILVMALGGEETVDPAPQAVETTPAVSPSPTETETAIESPSPEPEESPTPERTRSTKRLITEGISIQVLNATGDPAADDRIAERLEELGFDIVAVDAASRRYESTTVFWSYAEAQEAAERLADRFGWDSGQKPANLSETVALHVIVGEDEV